MTSRKLANVLLKIAGIVLAVYLLPSIASMILMKVPPGVIWIPTIPMLISAICLIVFSKPLSEMLFDAESDDRGGPHGRG